MALKKNLGFIAVALLCSCSKNETPVITDSFDPCENRICDFVPLTFTSETVYYQQLNTESCVETETNYPNKIGKFSSSNLISIGWDFYNSSEDESSTIAVQLLNYDKLIGFGETVLIEGPAPFFHVYTNLSFAPDEFFKGNYSIQLLINDKVINEISSFNNTWVSQGISSSFNDIPYDYKGNRGESPIRLWIEDQRDDFSSWCLN